MRAGPSLLLLLSVTACSPGARGSRFPRGDCVRVRTRREPRGVCDCAGRQRRAPAHREPGGGLPGGDRARRAERARGPGRGARGPARRDAAPGAARRRRAVGALGRGAAQPPPELHPGRALGGVRVGAGRSLEPLPGPPRRLGAGAADAGRRGRLRPRRRRERRAGGLHLEPRRRPGDLPGPARGGHARAADRVLPRGLRARSRSPARSSWSSSATAARGSSGCTRWRATAPGSTRSSPRPTLPGAHRDPAISPDGRRLAFVAGVSPEKTRLYVLELATGAVKAVSPAEGRAETPCWSPDGAMLAFAYAVPGQRRRCIGSRRTEAGSRGSGSCPARRGCRGGADERIPRGR